MGFEASRRKLINLRGRPMALNRLAGSLANGGTITTTSTSLTGVFNTYQPNEITGDIRVGDAKVFLTNDELSAAAITPIVRDQMVIDGATWFVRGSFPIYDGSTLIGFNLWIRGGAG